MQAQPVETQREPATRHTTTKGVVAYLVITFGGAWVLWAAALLSGIPATSPQFQYVAIPGAFAPAMGAIVVRKWITREGFADAGLRLNLRRGWRHYLFG